MEADFREAVEANFREALGPIVVLDRVQDPGNLGTIARVAEGAGASALVLTPGTADPGNPKALRASAGALLRLPATHTVFQPGPPTLLICRDDAPGEPAAEAIRLSPRDGALCPRDICAALWARGVRRLMIEGGGVTVSRFLSADRLDRLHLVVAPVVLGQGRPSLRLDEIASLDEAARPQVTRHALGVDTLFDCDFRAVRR